MELTDEDIREILRIIDESELDELRIEVSGLFLHVRRGSLGSAPPAAPDPAPAAAAEPQTALASVAGAAAPATADAPPRDTAGPEAALVVDAPMLGTFYRAEAPGDPPFVSVGDTVEPGTVICLIEVMKMMNHVTAGVSGTVVEVLADDGALVEFGQPLFQIAPAPAAAP